MSRKIFFPVEPLWIYPASDGLKASLPQPKTRSVVSIRRATVVSLAASTWSQAATAVSGVLAARMLGVGNRGYLALLVLWPTILLLVGDLGLPMAIPYVLAKNHRLAMAIARKVALTAAIQSLTLVAVHATVLFIFLQGRPAYVKSAGLVTLLILPSALCLEYGLSILQGQQRFHSFNFLRAAPATLYAVTCVAVFVIANHSSLVVLAGAWVAASLASAVIAGVVVWRGLPRITSLEADTPPLSYLLRFGLRGLLGSVSPIETFRLDQAVVGLVLSPAALGIYVVALAFTNFPRLVAQAVGLVAYPRISAQVDKKEAARSMWRFFSVGSLLSLAVALALVLSVGTLIPVLFGAEFHGAVEIARILLIAAFFLSARRVLADAVRGTGRPGAGSAAEIASWVVLVPALYLLVPRLGVIGVAVGFALAAAFSLFCLLFLAWKPRRPARVHDLLVPETAP